MPTTELKLELPQEKSNHQILSEIVFSKNECNQFLRNISDSKIKEIVIIWEEQVYAK